MYVNNFQNWRISWLQPWRTSGEVSIWILPCFGQWDCWEGLQKLWV